LNLKDVHLHFNIANGSD